MNTKNNRRYKAGNDKIQTAFLTLLYNKGYEEISVSEICDRAGVNRSTFYSHYDDINDLIIKIENKFANSMSMIFDFGLKQNDEAFEEMFKFIQDNKYFYKAFLSIPYTTHAETKSKNSILSNIKQTNSSPTTNDVELFYRASFFGAGIKEMCRLWIERDFSETPKQMAEMIKREYSKRK